MQPNRISGELTQQQIEDAINSIQAAIKLLDQGMVVLTPDERKEMVKMSDKTIAFVSKVANYCDSNPEFVPGYINVDEMKKDLKLTADLKKIVDKVNQLQRMVEDSMILAGSEAYMASLVYYANVRAVTKHGALNAIPIYEDLSERFPGTNKGKKFEQVKNDKMP